MTIRRSRHRAAQADQDAVHGGSLSGSEPIDRLLAEASAPAHADEVAGLGAALAMFTYVAPRPRRNPVLRVLAKLLAAKAIAIGGAAALGGVALAAAAGVLPAPAQDFAHDALKAPAAESSTHPANSGQRSPQSVRVPIAQPGWALPGLWRRSRRRQGKGPEQSCLHCPGHRRRRRGSSTGLLHDSARSCAGRKANRAAHPGTGPQAELPPDRPAGHAPDGPPATHPTGPPATHPTGAPTTHP